MYENIRDIKIDQDKLNSLHERLRHGDIAAIAKQLNLSNTTVKQVLLGHQFSREVIEAVIQRIEDRDSLKAELESNIDRVLKS